MPHQPDTISSVPRAVFSVLSWLTHGWLRSRRKRFFWLLDARNMRKPSAFSSKIPVIPSHDRCCSALTSQAQVPCSFADAGVSQHDLCSQFLHC